jgi:1,4-dihydroxy-2-naphthoate polyprenyltransferase
VLRVWVEAARPRTLSAAITPVLVGTAAAQHFHAWRFAAAMVVALAVQVGVNYANDYFDGVRGVDVPSRTGPRRAVASGLISPPQMRVGIVIALAVAAVAGLALAAATTWWLLAVGAACFTAALGYSGGRRPYGSAALGEVFVFVFFGLVATVGSAFVQDRTIPATAVAASVPVGLLATAILVVNNLRDRHTDQATGKTTLAVRLGDARTRLLFAALLAGALASVTPVAVVAASAWPLLALLAAPLAVAPLRAVRGGAAGGALVAVLGSTSMLHLAFGLLVALGLLLAGAPGGPGGPGTPIPSVA